MTEYLAAFEKNGLEYIPKRDEDRRMVAIDLRNLSALGGMEVAELLTYLYDDGFVHLGPMDVTVDGGALMVLREDA